MKKLVSNTVVTTSVKKLHVQSKPVDMNDKALLESLESEMIKCFNSYKGAMQGMAAIQICMPYCAILLRYKKWDDPLICFNPEVKYTIGSKESNEGCLSETGRYIVKRPLLARVSYYTSDGVHHEEFLPYDKARIFCHEYDHTKGILLQDKGRRV